MKVHEIVHFNSLHFTSLHFTSLHFTPLHFTSLHSTSIHFNSLQFTSLQITSLHFTSLQFTSIHFTCIVSHCIVLCYVMLQFHEISYPYGGTVNFKICLDVQLTVQLTIHQPPMPNSSQTSAWSHRYIGRGNGKTEIPLLDSERISED